MTDPASPSHVQSTIRKCGNGVPAKYSGKSDGPKIPTKLVPVMETDDTKALLEFCKGKDFLSLRDAALTRLFSNIGARLAEIANLDVNDVDLARDSAGIHGKWSKDRRVRIGVKTARALGRYLRAQAKHEGAELAQMWLAQTGRPPAGIQRIEIRLRRLGVRAGLCGLHLHRWWHSYPHERKLADGDTGGLMLLIGWSSDAMPRHYSASAAAERAKMAQRRMGIGDV